MAVDSGIVVNQRGERRAPDLWEAGAVAEIPAPSLNRTVRVAHEDNAVVGGRVAGENMAGSRATLPNRPFFYSDLFAVGFGARGSFTATSTSSPPGRSRWKTGWSIIEMTRSASWVSELERLGGHCDCAPAVGEPGAGSAAGPAPSDGRRARRDWGRTVDQVHAGRRGRRS